MKSIPREVETTLVRAARGFPAVVLTGPRRAGKTYCLRRRFPEASYHLLEDPDLLARVRGDPRGFLEDVRTPAILDEIQHAPELLAYVRTRIDRAPSRKGQWLITGSQDFALMEGVTESLAGRAAVFQLLPFSLRELGRWDLLRGGFPEVWARPRLAATWFRSYVQTYLERDVRDVTAVRDLGLFRRFLTLVAARNGAMLNKTDIAAPLGLSVPTVTEWIGVLETTGLVLLVPPWFENLGKRVVKTPKLYWTDTGLLCHLLGIGSLPALAASPAIGSVFEAFVASEIAKRQAASGAARSIHHFRDHQGFEVDFVLPERDGGILFVEAKWSRTVVPADARGIQALLPRVGARKARGVVVHRAAAEPVRSTALVPSVKALSVEAFLGGD